MSRKSAKLVALSLVALLLFNFPIVGIFTKQQWVWGFPAPYVYLFAVWFLVILGIRQIVEKGTSITKNTKDKPRN